MIYSIISILIGVQLMAVISAEVPITNVKKDYSGHKLGKFLIPLPTWKNSHEPPLEVLGSALAERGHTIHLLANGMSPRSLSNFGTKTMIQYETSITTDDLQKMMDEVKYIGIKSGSGFGGAELVRISMKLISRDCRALLTDTDTLARLRN